MSDRLLGGLLITETNALIYNNTIYNNPNNYGGMTFQDGGGHTVRNNILYQNDVIGMSLDSTNLIGTDPRFVDAANGNFRLNAGSPAINAGITLPEVTRAIDGTPRPQDTAPDIGAYEFTTAIGDVIPPASPMDLGAL